MIREIKRVHRSLLEHYPGHSGVAVILVHSSWSLPKAIEPGFHDVLRLQFDDDLPSAGAKHIFSASHAEEFVKFIKRLHEATSVVTLIIQGETSTFRRATSLALFAHMYCGAPYPDLEHSHDYCRSVLSVLRKYAPDVTVTIPNEKNA